MQNLKKEKGQKMIRFIRRKVKVNTKIKSLLPEFRVVVHKSNLYVRAQVLDRSGCVLVSVSDKGMEAQTKTARAELAGQKLAMLLKEKHVQKVTFDRNGYLYHGRVKAMADGLRNGGITL